MNKQLKSFFLALLLVCTFLFQGSLAAALANEIWVPPEKKDQNKVVGNWAVTNHGDAHFSFGLPDNMTEFLGAKVVVIGKKDKDITYDLHISVAQNGQRHDAITYSLTNVPDTLVKDELLEIDVSSIFPDPLYPGADYITLHFKADKKHEVRIIGMRFIYGECDCPITQEQLDELCARIVFLEQTAVIVRFADKGDGTIRDNKSGLIWLKDANCFGTAHWLAAMDAAGSLASGRCGLTDGSSAGDWRLPTKEEWEAFYSTVYDYPALANTIDIYQWKEGDAFTGVRSAGYWSSTEDGGQAVLMRMGLGYMSIKDKNDYHNVWPVRSDN